MMVRIPEGADSTDWLVEHAFFMSDQQLISLGAVPFKPTKRTLSILAKGIADTIDDQILADVYSGKMGGHDER